MGLLLGNVRCVGCDHFRKYHTRANERCASYKCTCMCFVGVPAKDRIRERMQPYKKWVSPPAPPNPNDYPVDKFAKREWSRSNDAIQARYEEKAKWTDVFKQGEYKYRNEPSWPEIQQRRIMAEIEGMRKLAEAQIILKAEDFSFGTFKVLIEQAKQLESGSKSKTAPRPSKKTSKKAKASKTVVNKLTITRVAPVLDEDV